MFNNNFHDPIRQINFLRESVQLGKKPLGIFLGAGCPLSIKINTNNKELNEINDISKPLIPAIFEMTEIIVKRLKENKDYKKSIQTLCDHFPEDQNPKPTIENFLSHLRSLIDVCGGQDVRGLSCDQMVNLEKAICDEIYNLVNVNHPDSNGPYHQLASWILSADREDSVEIFTTNYDLLMERAMEDKRTPFFDGFIGTVKPFFDPYAVEEEKIPSRWTGLWKLHGSINWRYDEEYKNVFRSSTEKIKEKERRLIHPSHLKYSESRKMPYLAMLDRLKAFLKKPSCLLITSGYSFADEHINDVIRHGLEGNISAHCFALAYGKVDKYSDALQLAKDRSNLTLLAKDGAVIGRKKAVYVDKLDDEINELNTIGVKWAEFQQSNVEGEELSSKKKKKYIAQCVLGDFVEFGEFLADITGEDYRIKKSSSANKEENNGK